MYFEVYLEHATPAPGNPRQNPISNPTPPTPCVPCEWVVSGFYVVFGIFGGGGGQLGVVSWFRKKDFRGGAEGVERGQGESERRVIDDDERGI